jgi:hypothetical protein
MVALILELPILRYLLLTLTFQACWRLRLINTIRKEMAMGCGGKKKKK